MKLLGLGVMDTFWPSSWYTCWEVAPESRRIVMEILPTLCFKKTPINEMFENTNQWTEPQKFMNFSSSFIFKHRRATNKAMNIWTFPPGTLVPSSAGWSKCRGKMEPLKTKVYKQRLPGINKLRLPLWNTELVAWQVLKQAASAPRLWQFGTFVQGMTCGFWCSKGLAIPRHFVAANNFRFGNQNVTSQPRLWTLYSVHLVMTWNQVFPCPVKCEIPAAECMAKKKHTKDDGHHATRLGRFSAMTNLVLIWVNNNRAIFTQRIGMSMGQRWIDFWC